MRDERCGVKAKGAGEVLEEQRVRGGGNGRKGGAPAVSKPSAGLAWLQEA